MKAVIPAAGEGKRFNKDSTYMHKCLVPINGKQRCTRGTNKIKKKR